MLLCVVGSFGGIQILCVAPSVGFPPITGLRCFPLPTVHRAIVPQCFFNQSFEGKIICVGETDRRDTELKEKKRKIIDERKKKTHNNTTKSTIACPESNSKTEKSSVLNNISSVCNFLCLHTTESCLESWFYENSYSFTRLL
jgi:hypothetical protein